MLRDRARQRAERDGKHSSCPFYGNETIRHSAFDPTRRCARQASTQDRLDEAARGRAERAASTAQAPRGTTAEPHDTAADSSRRPIPTPEAVSGRADRTDQVFLGDRLRELALRRAEPTDSSSLLFNPRASIRPGARDPTARQESRDEAARRRAERAAERERLRGVQRRLAEEDMRLEMEDGHAEEELLSEMARRRGEVEIWGWRCRAYAGCWI
jgi:hypothetical protein